MLEQRVLDLDRRDVLAAGDDDVLRAVAELHVAVGVLDAEVAGMEPAAGEGLVGRGLVLEVALHHDVAAEHDLAHRLPVGRNRRHRLGVHHVERLERMVADALARLEMRLGLGVERVPLLLPVVDHGRAVDLGQAVEVGDLEAGLAHRLEHGGRRRRGGGEEAHEMRQRLPLVARGR